MTTKNLPDFLGKERFNYLMANPKDEIGISRGLAWTKRRRRYTSDRGKRYAGKRENFLLTGQLGDVMKESAQAGINYIRSIADKYEIVPEYFENMIFIFIFRRGQFQRWSVCRYYNGNRDDFCDCGNTGACRCGNDR